MEPIHKRLKRLRDERNLKAADVASAIGVPSSTYKDWESGSAIQGEPYAKLAGVFQISIHELITGEVITKTEVARALNTLCNDLEILKKLLTETT